MNSVCPRCGGTKVGPNYVGDIIGPPCTCPANVFTTLPATESYAVRTDPPYDLRDLFAAIAMHAMYVAYQGNPPEPEQVCEDAYAIADGMLSEREKKE